jgi:hypothetical protein
MRQLMAKTCRGITLGTLLSLGGQVLAQLPTQPSTNPGQQSQLPPDINQPSTKPEHHHPAAAKDIQEKLEKGLESKNAAYAGSNIKVAVDDQTVTLTGTVTSSMQHEMALQLARAYGEDRTIVDHLVIQ